MLAIQLLSGYRIHTALHTRGLQLRFVEYYRGDDTATMICLVHCYLVVIVGMVNLA
jgi:hypothetical protein